MTPPKNDNRIVAIVLAVVAIGGLGYASMSKKWLYNPRSVVGDMEVGFGPRGNFMCAEFDGASQCETMSNAELASKWSDMLAAVEAALKENPNNVLLAKEAKTARENLRTNAAFSPFGWIAFVSILIAALSLAISVGVVLAKKRIDPPVMPTTTALLGVMIGLVSGCIFVALKPGGTGFVGVNLGFWAFGGGCIAGLASAIMLNKLMRPFDPDLLEDAMNPDDFPS